MNRDLTGFTAALAAIVIVAVMIIVIRKRFGIADKNYDERQILIRGKGYRIAFMTMLILCFSYAGFFYETFKDIVAPQLVIFAIGFIGITEYAIYCLLNDAYLQVGQNPKKWIILMIFVIVVNASAAISGSDRGLTVDGLVTGMAINAIIAISFSIILVVFVIKLCMDKRGEGNEES